MTLDDVEKNLAIHKKLTQNKGLLQAARSERLKANTPAKKGVLQNRITKLAKEKAALTSKLTSKLTSVQLETKRKALEKRIKARKTDKDSLIDIHKITKHHPAWYHHEVDKETAFERRGIKSTPKIRKALAEKTVREYMKLNGHSEEGLKRQIARRTAEGRVHSQYTPPYRPN